ncbi:MAG: hypothetical protein HC888_04495 [Candidatus Competibacteraceae bacterium]|nr:hypothetical protein [Candidatus Competibacteraceae bacterium]
MKVFLATQSLLFVLLACLMSASTTTAAEVQVRVDTALNINGYDQINRRVFGVFPPGRSDLDQRLPLLAKLNPGVVRLHPDIHAVGWEDRQRRGQFDPRVFDYTNKEWLDSLKERSIESILDNVPKYLPDADHMLLIGSLPTWLVKDADFRRTNRKTKMLISGQVIRMT